MEATEREILSVSELTARLKQTLEECFPVVWVCGEVLDLARPRSGHLYFTLKDDAAQLRAVMWRTAVNRLRFELADGMQVICCGGLDLYPPRGSYQLVAQHIEPRGIGARQLALRKLHDRLAAEGLFAAERKRRLPCFPRRVAFVTSPTGAAVRDFCEVLRSRCGVEVIVIPARVQGEGAAAEIAAGIHTAHRLSPLPDVLVVGRGGGSIDDLWCFNEELLIRAICASRIPVVSAVGHEIDVTLADLAADVRAQTPREAAQRVTPSVADLLEGLRGLQHRLAGSLRARAVAARGRLAVAAQSRALRRPMDMVHDRARRLDELEQRLARGMTEGQRRASQRVAALADRLESLSPLAVLARGYSLTERVRDGQLLRRAVEVEPGDQIRTRLAEGSFLGRVDQVSEESHEALS
jgi:exodeoxyribonuclease VII large subunit